jgi:reactive chlorine resistance protein C
MAFWLILGGNMRTESLMAYLDSLLLWLSRSDRFGHALMLAIAIVFIWIGAIKFAPYEADSITPFVANNTILSQFYEHPKQYKAHLTREGELVPAQRDWQRANQTYAFRMAWTWSRSGLAC